MLVTFYLRSYKRLFEAPCGVIDNEDLLPWMFEVDDKDKVFTFYEDLKADTQVYRRDHVRVLHEVELCLPPSP